MNVAPPSIVSGKRCLQTFLETQSGTCNKLSAPAPSLSTSSSTYGAKQAVSTLSSPPAPSSTYLTHPSTSSSVSLLALLALLPPARLKSHPRVQLAIFALTRRAPALHWPRVPPDRPPRRAAARRRRGKKALATARPARRPACRPRAHVDRRTHARQSWLLRRPARRFVSLFESARRCEGFRVHALWRRGL